MGKVLSRQGNPELQFSSMGSMSSSAQVQESNATERKRSPEYEPDCFLCGIGSPTKKNQSEVWRADFESCCKKLKQEFDWADIVRKAGVERKATRAKCMKQFQELKYELAKKLQNKEVPNKAEIRQLLNCSALLEQNVAEDISVRQSVQSFAKVSLASPTKMSFASPPKASFQGKPDGKFKGKGKKMPMVSILDQNMKALFAPKKMSTAMDEQVQSSVYLFVKFTELLQKHSQQPSNAICKIRTAFIKYIRDQYGKRTKLFTQEQDELTRGINAFIDLFTITIDVYYKVPGMTQNDKTRYIFSVENIKSVATVILFKNDGFYKLIFDLYELADKQFQFQLEKIVNQKQNVKPQDLKVAQEYCLNQLTLSWYLKNQASLERNGIDDVEIPTNTECEPFETCIVKLKQIEGAQTPISKLKVIISTAEKISGSINRFYEINNIPSNQMVDSDQILTIFIYIILHSNVYNLKTHLRFIENFCTEEQLMSETGYYSKVAEGALKMLVNDLEQQF